MLVVNILQRIMINYCMFGYAWIKIICKQYDVEIPLFKTKHYYLWKLLLDEFLWHVLLLLCV